MTFSDDDLRLGLQAINLVAVVWLAISGRNRVTKEALDAKLGGHSDRLTALERDLKHAPSHEDLKRLHQRLDEVSIGLATAVSELKSTTHILNLLHEDRLNEDRK